MPGKNSILMYCPKIASQVYNIHRPGNIHIDRKSTLPVKNILIILLKIIKIYYTCVYVVYIINILYGNFTYYYFFFPF